MVDPVLAYRGINVILLEKYWTSAARVFPICLTDASLAESGNRTPKLKSSTKIELLEGALKQPKIPAVLVVYRPDSVAGWSFRRGLGANFKENRTSKLSGKNCNFPFKILAHSGKECREMRRFQ